MASFTTTFLGAGAAAAAGAPASPGTPGAPGCPADSSLLGSKSHLVDSSEPPHAVTASSATSIIGIGNRLILKSMVQRLPLAMTVSDAFHSVRRKNHAICSLTNREYGPHSGIRPQQGGGHVGMTSGERISQLHDVARPGGATQGPTASRRSPDRSAGLHRPYVEQHAQRKRRP